MKEEEPKAFTAFSFLSLSGLKLEVVKVYWQPASFPGSLLKSGRRRESLGTFTEKFQLLAQEPKTLAVPNKLQNEAMCTRDILSTQQKVDNSKMNL